MGNQVSSPSPFYGDGWQRGRKGGLKLEAENKGGEERVLVQSGMSVFARPVRPVHGTGLTGLYSVTLKLWWFHICHVWTWGHLYCVLMCVIDLFMLSKWYCASVTQIVWCIVFLAGCLGQTGLTSLFDRSDRSAPDRATFFSLWWTELSCHMHHV